jgi:hypothetical protein
MDAHTWYTFSGKVSKNLMAKVVTMTVAHHGNPVTSWKPTRHL